MLVILWIFYFTFRDIRLLGNLIKGIFSNLFKGYGVLSCLLPVI